MCLSDSRPSVARGLRETSVNRNAIEQVYYPSMITQENYPSARPGRTYD